jgi:hypothetical protein
VPQRVSTDPGRLAKRPGQAVRLNALRTLFHEIASLSFSYENFSHSRSFSIAEPFMLSYSESVRHDVSKRDQQWIFDRYTRGDKCTEKELLIRYVLLYDNGYRLIVMPLQATDLLHPYFKKITNEI